MEDMEKTLTCWNCGHDLIITWEGDNEVIVKPCEYCIEEATEEGYEEGYQAGIHSRIVIKDEQ